MVDIPMDFKTQLESALRDGDSVQSGAVTEQLLEMGVAPFDIVQQVLVPTLTKVGKDFQDSCIFLPELMMTGAAAQHVTTLLDQATRKTGQPTISMGTVVIGQAEGDVHDIGRNIVVTMLSSHGFKVVDLGHDVRASAFLDVAQREKANIVGLSALMTTTLPAVQRTINLFCEVGARGDFKIVVGGGATNQGWANLIGADGYAVDAPSAIELCKELLGA